MTKNTIIGISAVVVAVLIGIIWFSMYASYNNQEAQLRSSLEAQQDNVGNVLDNMWKNFQEIGGIPDRERETAMEMFVNYADARTADGQGRMMAWVTENAPQPLSTQLYKDLQDRLTAGRQEFRNSQTYLLDLKRQHDTLRRSIPAKWFISDEELLVTIVTSKDTKAAMESGEDERTFQLPAR